MSKEQVGCRPVRIHLAMKDGPLSRSIKQILPTIGNEKQLVYVERVEEADLVIFSEVRAIEGGYNASKTYAFMGGGRDVQSLPSTVVNVYLDLVRLVQMIHDVWLSLKPLEVAAPVETVAEAALRPDALRILVVEDSPKHQASAKKGLAGHKLTLATGYEEAMKILDSEKFDVVLTDLQMPMSSRTLGSEAFKLGQLVPYGLLLKDEAAHQGAKWVAVVTDLNHHADWVSAAFDHFSYPMQIEGAKVLMMHAPMNDDDTKDWAAALDRLMKD
jgi:CheY-like chemotaxis protein